MMKVDWNKIGKFVDDMGEFFDIAEVVIENDAEDGVVVSVVINDDRFYYEELSDVLDTDDWGVELRGGLIAIWKRFIRN